VENLTERLRRLTNAAREAADAHAAAREARDAAIMTADDEGMKLREIARGSGLSLSHVQRIVVEQTARRQDAIDQPEND
jgi:DNA invertase Pin-like site-specific DNA recombinase